MNPRDTDPLDVTEQMWTEGWVAGHNWVYVERCRHHRDMLVLALLGGLLVATGFMFGRVSAAPRPGPDSTARELVDQGRTGAPPSQSTPSAGVAREGTATPAPTSEALELVTRTGTLAFAEESYGPDYLAVPIGPGHLVEVCGPGGCETLVSTDAGPNREMLALGRIADLAIVRFAHVCGFSDIDEARLRGLCSATWTVVG